MMRDKPQVALSYFFKAAKGRSAYMNSMTNIYQISCLISNIAFVYKNNLDFDKAGLLINKHIMFLEELD